MDNINNNGGGIHPVPPAFNLSKSGIGAEGLALAAGISPSTAERFLAEPENFNAITASEALSEKSQTQMRLIMNLFAEPPMPADEFADTALLSEIKIVNRYYAVPLKALAERASVDLQSIELYANESQTDALSIEGKFKLSAVTSMFMRVLSKYTETIPQWVEL